MCGHLGEVVACGSESVRVTRRCGGSVRREQRDQGTGVLRRQFYPDETDRFYKHRFMLVQAIACPATACRCAMGGCG